MDESGAPAESLPGDSSRPDPALPPDPAPPEGGQGAAGRPDDAETATAGALSPEAASAAAVQPLEELTEPLSAATAGAPLEPGTRIGGSEGQAFRITCLIERTGDAYDYEAVEEETGRSVWLREAGGPTGERLRREAEARAGLEAPQFPQLVAAFGREGKTYLATEPATGPTLAEALAAGETDFRSALGLLAQVAYALGRLHARGWCYLGLRPAAVVLGRPVKLVDFSHATPLGEPPAAPFQHAGYSPPELLDDAPVDVRADVYGVGALLYHLVNGAPLPESGPELATWSPPAPLGGVPQILHRCLGSLETRYRTMEALHRDLLALARRAAGAVRYSVAAATDIGLEPERTTNQDAYVYLTGQLESEGGAQSWAALAVCDGMGGMEAGEVASDAAVKAFAAQAASLAARRGLTVGEQVELVKGWMQAANEAACAALDRRDAHGGATLVGAAVLGRRLAIAHVGDCRLYRLRSATIEPLTRDHSLVMALALQGEVAMDAIRHHPDRSTVTRSLGDRHPLPEHQIDTLEPATGSPVMELEPGDLLLFCSDGLWEPVVEEEMIATIRAHGPNLVAAAEALVDLALQRGGPDNVTVVLFRLDG